MARPLRIEYPGAVYHVISRGNNKQSVFRNDRDRERYLEKLSDYCQEKGVNLCCYCLLSNHVHLLLETPKGNLSRMMQPLQTSYTVYFNRRHRHTGHVFEQRYKAFLVDKDNYLLQASRYIHLNPVEARIVREAHDYRWSSYRQYVTGKGEIEVARDVILDYFSGSGRRKVQQYREFVEGAVREQEKLWRLPILKQIFIGDEKFVEQVKRKESPTPDERPVWSLQRAVRAVSQATGVAPDEMRRSLRTEPVRGARELLVYVARKHGDIGTKQLAAFLSVKEVSTVSHGLKRAERRRKEDRKFNRQVNSALRLYAEHSEMADTSNH